MGVIYNPNVEEQKRQAERKEREEKNHAAIENYCKKHGFFFAIGYEDDVVVIKPLTNESRSLLAKAQKQPERMNGFIAFMEKYPDNNDARIIKRGTMECILEWIK